MKATNILILIFSILISTHPAFATEYNPQGLNPSTWTITDEHNSNVLSNLTDNNPSTYSTVSSNPATGAAGFVINLGAPTVVDRVYVTGPTTAEGQSTTDGNPANWLSNVTTPPAGMITVYVGNTPNPTTQVAQAMLPADAGNPVDTEADLRFQPVVAQYIRVEVQTANIDWSTYFWGTSSLSPPATLPWNVGEVEVHGFVGQSSITPKDAVVLPANAASPLAVAAQDLSYYLGKLEGNPVPIITAAQESSYPGTLYVIEDLQSLAPDYNTMVANEKSGLLPSDVSVVQSGNQVQFSGWPYRNVLKSVWTFLAAQGIHWVYPSPHGDYIPVTGTVNLSMLPLSASSVALPNTTPPNSVYANWEAGSFMPFAPWINQTIRQGFLNIWRAGWNFSWNNPWQVLGGSEVPTPIPTSNTLSSTLPNDYSTGFTGYPHNFNGVVPQDVLTANPTWCGYDPNSGTRNCNPGSMAFDMTNPDLINWVADKMTAVAANSPVDESGAWVDHNEWYGLLPVDATAWDGGPNSLQANSSSASSVVTIPDPVPWVSGTGLSQSGAYYNMVNQVALKVKAQNPGNPPIVGALAYSDVFLPPPSWEVPTLSNNIRVEICQYGSPNLPIASAPNAAFKQALDQWHSLASASGTLLGNYDYTLLHTDYWQPNPQLPVPMVAGIVDRADYLANMGALEGGSQASPSSFPYNPWNFYAYARVRQNTKLTASQIENEFFTSYFKEAATPMLAYYQTMENWQVQNNVDMHDYGYAESIMQGSFPNQILATMNGYLQQAQNDAKSWIVQKRVADMATGFNWILTQRNLQVSNLTNTSNYQAVGQDNQPVSLSLQNGVVSLPYLNPNGNGGYIGNNGGGGCTGSLTGYGLSASSCPGAKWSILGGVVYLPLYFVQSGTYQITFQAQGGVYNGSSQTPPMTVYLGPQNLGTINVTATYPNTANYSLTANVPAGFGVQDLWVQDPNGFGVSIFNITITRTSSVQTNYGDVDGNGSVNIVDAEETAQESIGLTVPNFNSTAAEVDGTGKVDINDAYLIAEYAVGLITKFPVS